MVHGFKIVFRTDASIQIGTGHVMRCLTLADLLKSNGIECHFICRQHPGHLMDLISSKGHIVHSLPYSSSNAALLHESDDAQLEHATWLATSQNEDADMCIKILRTIQPQWLIVDHYALDARWEVAIKPYCRKLMVIDDLADRLHDCDLLLDQNIGRTAFDYNDLVPCGCSVLAGPKYAMMRPEFAALRSYSLQRRSIPQFRHLLISMGGVDRDNSTGKVLAALNHSSLPNDCSISVVMGTTAPWMNEVREFAKQMPWSTEVRVGISDMAKLMADSDLAIGAAGVTSWERCCLGLPTLMLVLAENQRMVALGLERAGAAKVLQGLDDIHESIPRYLGDLVSSPLQRTAMSHIAAGIVDGSGTASVIHHLEFRNEYN